MNDILNNIGKNMPYSIPADYFEKQKTQLKAIASNDGKALHRSNTVRWLSAAAVALCLLTGAGCWFHKNANNTAAAAEYGATNIYCATEDVNEEVLMELAEADIFINEF